MSFEWIKLFSQLLALLVVFANGKPKPTYEIAGEDTAEARYGDWAIKPVKRAAEARDDDYDDDYDDDDEEEEDDDDDEEEEEDDAPSHHLGSIA